MNRPLRKVIIMVSVFASLAHPALVLKHNGHKIWEMQSGGDFVSRDLLTQSGDLPQSEDFGFRYAGDASNPAGWKMWSSSSQQRQTHITGVLGDDFLDEGVVFNYKGTPQVELRPDGDLSKRGYHVKNATHYARGPLGEVNSVYDALGEKRYDNLYGVGLVGRQNNNGEQLFYLKDHLGNTRAVLSIQGDGTGGEVREAYDYHPYGTIVVIIASPDATRRLYVGKEFDEDGQADGSVGIEQYHFQVRQYDPLTGRWQSVDPPFATHDTYNYGNSNPVVHLDPDGNNPILIIAGIIIIATAIVDAIVSDDEDQSNIDDGSFYVSTSGARYEGPGGGTLEYDRHGWELLGRTEETVAEARWVNETSIDAAGVYDAGPSYSEAFYPGDQEILQFEIPELGFTEGYFHSPVQGKGWVITSPYGKRGSVFHHGVDFGRIGGAAGYPVYASEDGIVAFSGRERRAGQYIKVKHEDRVETLYMHLGARLVQTGETVLRGQIIGYTSNTGLSRAGKPYRAHLHYEVRIGGRSTDASMYVIYQPQNQ